MTTIIFVTFLIVLLALPQLAATVDSAKKSECVIEASGAGVAGGDLCDHFKSCCDRKCGGRAKSATCKVESGKIIDTLDDTSCTCAGMISRANLMAMGVIVAATFIMKRFNS